MSRRRRRRPPGDPATAVAYLRVSTAEQAKSGLGLTAQRRALETWAAREGVQIASWHVDEGVSGSTPAARRPGLMAALGALRENRAGILIAAKRDRFARDVDAMVLLRREAERSGANVTTPDGLPESAASRLQRTIVDAVAEFELSMIRERTRAALAAKKAKGEVVGQVPFGYVRAGDRLVPDDREQRIIQVVLELREEGLSYHRIAAELTTRGCKPRGKSGRWYAPTVQRIVQAAQSS